MKREGPIFLKPGPERDALLNAFATVADRVAARKEARLREQAPEQQANERPGVPSPGAPA